MAKAKAAAKEVSFKSTKAELALVKRIVGRVFDNGLPIRGDRMDLEMDLLAAHANGCPLDFAKLLEFDDFNFVHDIFGIRRHIDRTTGELTGFFLPRCAKPSIPVEG